MEEDCHHWNVTEEIMQSQEPEKPRILVCGPGEAGKSSLINLVLGRDLVRSFLGRTKTLLTILNRQPLARAPNQVVMK